MRDKQKNLIAIHGIIFDIDGVIFDSKNTNVAYYNTILKILKLPPMSCEDEAFCHMASAGMAYKRIIPPGKDEEVLKAVEQHPYNDYVLPKLKLEDGLVETLTWMSEIGIKLGICTNRSNEVPQLLHRFGIESFFSPIKSAYNCKAKPDPQGLLETVNEWKLPKSQMAFLGDTDADEQAARSAGVSFWAFRNPSLNADLHFTDFFSFMEIIKPLVQKKACKNREIKK